MIEAIKTEKDIEIISSSSIILSSSLPSTSMNIPTTTNHDNSYPILNYISQSLPISGFLNSNFKFPTSNFNTYTTIIPNPPTSNVNTSLSTSKDIPRLPNSNVSLLLPNSNFNSEFPNSNFNSGFPNSNFKSSLNDSNITASQESMELSLAIPLSTYLPSMMLFLICDGHGGFHYADDVSKVLPSCIQKSLHRCITRGTYTVYRGMVGNKTLGKEDTIRNSNIFNDSQDFDSDLDSETDSDEVDLILDDTYIRKLRIKTGNTNRLLF